MTHIAPEHDAPEASNLGDLGRLAVPVILTELGTIANGVVATIIVGRLGPEAIGAVGLGNVLFGTLAVFGQGLLLGLDPMVSQAYGARRLEDCRRWLLQGLLLSLAVALPLIFLLNLLARSLPLWGIAAGTVSLAVPFLEIRAWAILPAVLFAAFRRYLQAMSIARPVAIVMWTSNLLNFVAAVVLVHGIGPIPPVGVTGAAWAALASGTGAAVALAGVVWFIDLDQPAAAGQRLDVARLRRLVALGLPAAFQVTLEVGVFAAATALAGAIDPASLAAHHIVLQIVTLTWVVTVGIGASGGVLVGQALGADDPALARRRGWTALAGGTAFMTCMAVVLVAVPGLILSAFTDDAEVVALGRTLLLIAAGFQLFDGMQAVATGALRGLGDTRTPMIANLAGHWILGLPLGYFLGFSLDRGVAGLWVGLCVGLVAVAIALVGTWNYRSRAAWTVVMSSRA